MSSRSIHARFFLLAGILVAFFFFLRFVFANPLGGWLDVAILGAAFIVVIVLKVTVGRLLHDMAVNPRQEADTTSRASDRAERPALPVKSAIRVVEATAERLVFYIPPAGGTRAKFCLCAAVGWNLALIAVCTFAMPAGGGWLRPLLLSAMVGAVLAGVAIKWNFERTFLLLDRERLVLQHVILGVRRLNETVLVPSSRAELIPPHNRGTSLCAIRVRGKNGTARFGRTFTQETEEENHWLVDRINQFLSRAAPDEGAADPRWLEPDALPHDSLIRVDECSPDVLRIHFVVPPPAHEMVVCVSASAMFAGFLWMVVVVLLTGMLFPAHLVPQYLSSALILFAAILSVIAIYWSCKVFGRTTLTLASGKLIRRKHIGWLDVAPTVVVPTITITDVHCECQASVQAPPSGIRPFFQPATNRPRSWSVVLSSAEPLFLSGFPSEQDAAQLASLLRTRLREM